LGFFGFLLSFLAMASATVGGDPHPIYGFLGTPLGGGITGLFVGLVLGVLTARSMIAKYRRNDNKRLSEEQRKSSQDIQVAPHAAPDRPLD
jgi:hypothetical protein